MNLGEMHPLVVLLLGGAGSYGVWQAVRDIIKLVGRRQDLTFAAGGEHEQRLWTYIHGLEQRIEAMASAHKAEVQALRDRLDREESYNRYQAVQLARIAGAYEALAHRPFEFDPLPENLQGYYPAAPAAA